MSDATAQPDTTARPGTTARPDAVVHFPTEVTAPFTAAIAEAEQIIRDAPFVETEQDLAEGMHYLAASIRAVIQGRQHVDRTHPVLAESTGPYTKMGLDNPDTLYFHANLTDGAEYLVEGVRGTTADLAFQVLQGNYSASEVAGSVAAWDDRSLQVAADGSFTFRMGPIRADAGPGTAEPGYIGLAPGSSIFSVREVYSDWEGETPGRLWIRRLDTEHTPPADPDTADAVVRFYDRIARALVARLQTWQEFPKWFFGDQEPNTFHAPRPTPGGLATQYSSAGLFDLRPDQAIVVSVPDSGAPYQGFQLGSMWYTSLDYVGHQTSLTSRQAHVDDDGMIHMVISARDPGVANWVETLGRRRGVMQFRWQRLDAPIEPENGPVARVVEVDRVLDELPTLEGQRVTAEQWGARTVARRAAFARRMRS